MGKRVSLHWDASFTVGVTISNLFNSPHFYNPSGDITSSSVARFQSAIGDYFPEKQGRRMIMLKGRLEW
jgi:hypothetical protein